MRLSRFYTNRTNITLGSNVKLDDSDINHVRKVLRLKKDDEIVLFNGEKEYLAKLRLVKTDVITAKVVKVLKSADFSKEGGIEFTLFQGLPRAGKMDLILKHTTELGIQTIIPVETEYSQVKAERVNEKIERWRKVILAASKQCQRIKVPEVLDAIKFSEVIEQVPNYDVFYFFTTPTNKSLKGLEVVKLQKEKKKISSIAYFIGPEGGFSPNEHKMAAESRMKIVTLPGNVLTTENAAISALAILSFINQI